MTKRKKNTTPKSLFSSDDKERYEQGVRALARLIARAYLRDRGLKDGNEALLKGGQSLE